MTKARILLEKAPLRSAVMEKRTERFTEQLISAQRDETDVQRETAKKLLEQFLHTVETQEPVTQFDERLWSSLVDFVTVYSEKDIRVTFKDGTEIQV